MLNKLELDLDGRKSTDLFIWGLELIPQKIWILTRWNDGLTEVRSDRWSQQEIRDGTKLVLGR